MTQKVESILLQGDCLSIMPGLPDNSIDTVITDPPYGLSFMGRKWDYDVPSVALWKEVLRVLKPGGTMLCFAGSRTQHRMAVNVEDAGFILKDCIMWLYGSGFPKATDISKQLDKRVGAERIIVGRNPNSREQCSKDNTLYESGTVGKTDYITAPTSPEAVLWNGWKSHGLKPAYEPILVAVKPNDGTYAENALKWGVAGLNIDGGRIGTDEEITNHSRSAESAVSKGKYGDSSEQETHQTLGQVLGRFPVNIILNEEAAAMLDEQSGLRAGCKPHIVNASLQANKNSKEKGWGSITMPKNNMTGFDDSGGASRFFYTAKASKSERNAGCESLPDQLKLTQMRSANGTGDKNFEGGFQDQIMKNTHPTVKPLALMEYLCTLTKTPTGGLVLDPFAGSGTTGVACLNTGRHSILIEKEPEYWPIIEARLAKAGTVV
jgi:site-specific DNA-methyltransferase (adenine-specific)